MRQYIDLFERAQTTDLASLKARGFDVDELLYHGTREDRDDLDKGHGRTSHIYLATDPRTASYYGSHIHVCVARQAPAADLTEASPLTRQLSEQVYHFFRDRPEVDQQMEENGLDGDAGRRIAAIDYTEALVLSGLMWEVNVGGMTFQDALLTETFALGFRSIRINDTSHTGISLSVVFDNGEDIAVLEHHQWTIGGFKD